MNVFRRVVSSILGLLLLFFVPIVYCSLKQEVLKQQILVEESNGFLENVGKQGRITSSMLEGYIEKVSHGCSCDVRLTHKKWSMEPEYRFKTLDEILMEQKKNYTGGNPYTYVEVKTELPYVKQEEPSSLKMNTETNESVLKTYPLNPCDKGHVHTNECNIGHFHEGQPKFTYKHTHNSSCHAIPTIRYLRYYCDQCKKTELYPFWEIHEGYFDKDKPNPDTSRYYQFNCYCGNTIYSFEKVTQYYYDCSFSKDMDGDGLCDIMPQIEMEYPDYSSEPQVKRPPTHSYQTGCYRYHTTIDIEDRKIGGPASHGGSSFVPSGSIYYSMLNLLIMLDQRDQNEIRSKLCYVPRYYTFTVQGEGREYLPYRAYSFNVTYELVLPENGGEPYFQYESSDVLHPDPNTPWLKMHEWKLVKEYSPFFRMYLDNTKKSYYEYSFPETLPVSKVRYYITTNRYDDIFNRACVLYENGELSHPDLCDDYRLIYTENKYEIVRTSGKIMLCTEYGKDGWERVCGKDEDGHLACNEKIVSIVATHPQQSIYQGETLITTLLVTYMDGATKVVVGTCTLDTNHCGENQSAYIRYKGINALGEVQEYSIMILVNIIPKSKCCARGHNYYLKENGSDAGCPFCQAWLESLVLINPNNAYIEVQQGSTLEQNGISLLATYLDGRKEIVTKGYIDNLDSSYVGLETVTIGYKGIKVELQVKVFCKRKKCTICGKQYEIYPDGSDPGCPYCLEKIPVFTGNVLCYETNVTMEEILRILEEKGEYTLSRQDELHLITSNKSHSLAKRLLQFVGLKSQIQIHTEAIIRIRDESLNEL